MERKITNELIKWKLDAYKKPMILYGNSGVGKTYTILNFGKICNNILFLSQISTLFDLRCYFGQKMNNVY